VTLAEVSALAPNNFPACFKTRWDWIEYLKMAQESKTKPFRHGVFIRGFEFCNDCTLEHSVAMSREGKCTPSMFRVEKLEPSNEHA